MDRINTPKEAFITLENEKGYEKMLSCEEGINLFGATMSVSEATDPTNIIFENKDTTMSNRCAKSIGIAVVISLMFVAIVLLTLFMEKDGARIIDELQSADCSKTGVGYSVKKMVTEAVSEWKQKNEDPEGILSCFCSKEYA